MRAAKIDFIATVVGGLIVVAIDGALLSGCPSPRLPPVEGCRVTAMRCHGDRPQVCSSTGRWHDTGDLACGAVDAGPPQACVEDDAGAHCALIVDGGAR